MNQNTNFITNTNTTFSHQYQQGSQGHMQQNFNTNPNFDQTNTTPSPMDTLMQQM
jgi:hypothetical protein